MIGNVQKPQKMQPFDAPLPSMFTLQRSNKVAGNTWRYTVSTGDNGHSFMTQSWSTPKTYFLCSSSEGCGQQNGMEMKNIFDDFMSGNGKPYMHLVPTSTMQPMNENDYVFEDEEYPYESWTDSVMNRMKGCGHKMKTWYYGDDVADDDVVEMDLNDEQFVNEGEGIDQYQDENVDLVLVGMSVIISLIVLCGVVYAGWRYVFEQKEKRRIMDPNAYVAMKENDKF